MNNAVNNPANNATGNPGQKSGVDARVNLIGMDRDDLAALVQNLGEQAFRAKQLWHWLYHQGAQDISAMTSLGKSLRAKLEDCARVTRPSVSRDLKSADGSRKWLLAFDDGNEAESVFIPEEDRGALCVSSQVGCTLNCSFCHTGTQTRVRDLTPAEIVGQVMIARDGENEWPSGVKGRRLTNIVMMGMGEPLMNYDNVAKALRIIIDSEGIAISRRRITLSTSGVVPRLKQLGEDIGCGLAISLHACNDELRDVLVPINRKYPLNELLAACRDYPGASNSRRITMEYVMLKDVNDSADDARELVRLMRKFEVPAKFNLIPFNPWPGTQYECSSGNAMHRFADILNDAGYSAPIRQPRGRDIMAACGQLKTASEHARKRAASEKSAAEIAADLDLLIVSS